MGMKTAGYLLFTFACLASAAVLGLKAASSADDDASAQIALANAIKLGPSTAPAATVQAKAPAPVAPAPPPPPEANDATAAVRAWMAAPPRMTREMFANVVAQRPWRSRFVDVTKLPLLTPVEFRRKPLALRPTTQRAVAVRGLPETPPLATVLDPPRPEPIQLATGRGIAQATYPQPLPLLRLPLVLRPRPETLPPQGDPILTVQGTTQLPVLPSFRLRPAPAVQGAESIDRSGDVRARPVPDDNPPAAARSLLPRDPLR